jgi:predicted GH43/DUF377 family glycosyl hydrolase
MMVGEPGEQALIAVVQTDVELGPDCRRVIVRPFLADEQVLVGSGMLGRLLRLPEDEVEPMLASACAKFSDRHRDLETVLETHFRFVAREANELLEISRNRRLLIGAFYTSEYAVEAAALTNPSMVPAPDQSGLERGAQRFIMSLRAIGEGHLSSIEFRAGVIDAAGAITVETTSGHLVTGSHEPRTFEKADFLATLVEMDVLDDLARSIIEPLPDRFDLARLEASIASAEGKRAPCRLSDPTSRAIHMLATSNYEVTFPSTSDLSERVLFPGSSIESHGLEDARFVRFVEEDGSVTYYATYTAFDGFRVLPQLIETVDFVSFRIATLSGSAAQNKGTALFPRKIDGRYVALSRFDAENNHVMWSDRLDIWDESQMIESPESGWELARVGNCGSPLETDAGWLVITHGVGPYREYSLGAMLLDLDDPARVIGRLDRPLLTPAEAERDGYVPNVVYSCGGMIHGDELILPYGVSDRASRIARVPIGSLLAALGS